MSRTPSEATIISRNETDANAAATLPTSYPNPELHHQDQHSPTPATKSPFNSHSVGGYSEYIHESGDVVERIVTSSPRTLVFENSPSRTVVTRTVVNSPTSVVTRTVSSPSATRVIRTTISSPAVQTEENITVPTRSPIHQTQNLSPKPVVRQTETVTRSPVFRDISLELAKEEFDREYSRTINHHSQVSSPSRTVVTTTSSPARTVVTRTISPSKKETVITTTTTTSSPVSSPVRRVVTYSPSTSPAVERIETTYVSSPLTTFSPNRGSPLKTATPKLSGQN